MKVLVIRHSLAVDPYDAPSDELRWLTDEGRRRMRAVSEELLRHLRPTVLFTSPLTRAVQTAEIFASVAAFDGPVIVHPPLAAEYGTTAQALSVLERVGDAATVVLVSHAPKVRVLAGHLCGEPRMPSFRTAGSCLVEDGEFRWMLDPEPLRLRTDLDGD